MGMQMSFRAGVPMLRDVLGSGGRLGDTATFEVLRHQADVMSLEKHGQLLVDEQEHKDNMRLWIELLHFRQRLDGSVGVLDVWQGMQERNIDVPIAGEDADVLWPALLNAMLDGKKLEVGTSGWDPYAYILDLKARTGRHYDGVHPILVGSSFRTNLRKVQALHKNFVEADMVPADGLKRVVADAVRSATPAEAFKIFRKLYRKSSERDLYDICLSTALDMGQGMARISTSKTPRDYKPSSLALDWHRFLLSHGDGPSEATFARSDVQQLFDVDKDRSLPMKHAKKRAVKVPLAISSTSATARALTPAYAPITRASMSSLVGDVHGIKAKEISDTFVAKMFATRAFPLDLVINGLSFFSVDAVGPVALHELAIRAGSPIELCNKLNELRGMKITITDTPYTRLLRHLATEGLTDMYHALLSSDQHPEAYADTVTQENLLTSFLEAGNLTQAHLTLTCLSLSGSVQQAAAWNSIAQHYLSTYQHTLVAQTIQQMQRQKLPLARMTMIYLHRYLLPVRRVRKRPVESQRPKHTRPTFNALDFVTHCAMYTENIAREQCLAEARVGPALWRELLKRYGMTHRWPQFERLVLWLADSFGGRLHRITVADSRNRRGFKLRRYSPLLLIFDQQMQQAIFNWGYRSAAVRNGLCSPPIPNNSEPSMHTSDSKSDQGRLWYQGLYLLLQLRSIGVPVSTETVQQAMKVRMWILLGPAHSQVPFNEMVRSRNQVGLAEYITTANELWPSGLFSDIPSALLKAAQDGVEGAEGRLYLAFFGAYARTGYRKEGQINEYADIRGWVAALESKQEDRKILDRGTSVRQSYGRWRHSPLRVELAGPLKMRMRKTFVIPRVWNTSEPDSMRDADANGMHKKREAD